MPSGGDGYYYFSTYLLVDNDEYGAFDIRVNGETLCTAVTEQQDTPNDPGHYLDVIITDFPQEVGLNHVHFWKSVNIRATLSILEKFQRHSALPNIKNNCVL